MQFVVYVDDPATRGTWLGVPRVTAEVRGRDQRIETRYTFRGALSVQQIDRHPEGFLTRETLARDIPIDLSRVEPGHLSECVPSGGAIDRFTAEIYAIYSPVILAGLPEPGSVYSVHVQQGPAP